MIIDNTDSKNEIIEYLQNIENFSKKSPSHNTSLKAPKAVVKVDMFIPNRNSEKIEE